MVKDGDNVFFKTKHGEIISGVLVKGVVYGKGKKKYRPPADKIFKTKQEVRRENAACEVRRSIDHQQIRFLRQNKRQERVIGILILKVVGRTWRGK